jgi:hypothetical protein
MTVADFSFTEIAEMPIARMLRKLAAKTMYATDLNKATLECQRKLQSGASNPPRNQALQTGKSQATQRTPNTVKNFPRK